MNFLAHLWLARATHTSMAGAVLGDVVHGRIPGLGLSAELALGVRIHRRVDIVTDHHALSTRWRAQFPASTRRYAGIALDLLCDHALALDWPDYARETLGDFATRAGHALAAQAVWFQRYGTWKPEAQRFAALLLSYREWAGFEHALARTAARLRAPQRLLDTAPQAMHLLPEVRAGLPTLLADLEAAATQLRDETQDE